MRPGFVKLGEDVPDDDLVKILVHSNLSLMKINYEAMVNQGREAAADNILSVALHTMTETGLAVADINPLMIEVYREDMKKAIVGVLQKHAGIDPIN